MSQYRPNLERKIPVTTPGLIQANLLDVLGDSDAGEMELEFPQFKEILTPADLQAQYLC
jgi:hypothetical protein